jgi:membrane associated rhomboid family serine protease
MNSNYKPFFTIAICILTVCVSFFVAYQISGSILGKSRIIYLADYGGLTVESIKEFEIWRFITSQFVHVHQKHMMYNVLSIMFLGVLLERKIGFRYTLSIWLFAGAIGTLFTTQFGSPPWNTGTGASQAALGFAGFALVFYTVKFRREYILLAAILFAILPALYLDLKTAGYPKPGHSLSFIIGSVIAVWYLYKSEKKEAVTKYEQS